MYMLARLMSCASTTAVELPTALIVPVICPGIAASRAPVTRGGWRLCPCSEPCGDGGAGVPGPAHSRRFSTGHAERAGRLDALGSLTGPLATPETFQRQDLIVR